MINQTLTKQKRYARHMKRLRMTTKQRIT